MVAGGFKNGNGVSAFNILTEDDLKIKEPQNLPKEIDGSTMVLHGGSILLCGTSNNLKQCLHLDHGTWKEHSNLNNRRVWHSVVTTKTATFVFGGGYSSKTYEYLPKDSSKWLMGKTEIPGGFESGWAISVKSGQEIWLIGGDSTEKRILKFNVESHTFQVLPFQLNVGRYGHRCAFIPNTNKVMITGGNSDGYQDSTEILDTEDGSVTMASPMNSKKYGHGMGVVTINSEDKVAVFGGLEYPRRGNELDDIEFYNAQIQKWELADFKLSEPKVGFGFLPIKLGDILSQL